MEHIFPKHHHYSRHYLGLHPVPGFPANGLLSKVFFDRIREVVGLIGIIADEEFLCRYCPVPRILMMGDIIRMLALFDCRFIILGFRCLSYPYI